MSGHPLDFLKDYNVKTEADPEQQQTPVEEPAPVIYTSGIVPVQQDGNPVVPAPRIVPTQQEGRVKKTRKKRVLVSKRELARQAARERRRQGRGVINEKCACHLSCVEKITEEHRKVLNEQYWNMDLIEQKAFVKAHSAPGQVKRRRVAVDPLGGGMDCKKAFTYSFNLPDPQGELQSVCCTFFLNTIGFRQGCGNTIYRTHMKDITQDKRGKYERDRTLHDAVWDDILSYSPRTYHKGSKFSATALYLPTKLNAKIMHGQFKARQEAIGLKAGSGSFYCSVMREMDVHFVEMDDFEIPERKPIPVPVELKEEEPQCPQNVVEENPPMIPYEQCTRPVQAYQPSPAIIPVHDQTPPIHSYQMEHKPAVVHYTNVPHQVVQQNYHVANVKQEPYYGLHIQSAMPSHEPHYQEHDNDDYSESYSTMVEDHVYSQSSYKNTPENVVVPGEPKVEIIQEEYLCSDSYEESHEYQQEVLPEDQSQPMNSSESENPLEKKKRRPKRPSEPTPQVLPASYPAIKYPKRFIKRTCSKIKRQQAHPVMQLDCTCIWNCKDKISLDQQERINARYWNMGFCDQRLFLLEHTERHSIKRRRAKVPDEGNVRKGYTYSYKLTDSNGGYQNVCCQFFLNTIGFGTGSGNVIYRAHQVELSVAISDQRGKFARDRTLRDAVDDDILSHFSPEQQDAGMLDLSDTNWSPKKLFNEYAKKQAAMGNDKPGSFAFYWRRTKELKVIFAPRPEPKHPSTSGKPRIRKRPQKQGVQQEQQQPQEEPTGYLYVPTTAAQQ